MANGLLKKLVQGTATSGSALLAVQEARAASADWSKFEDCINVHNADYPQYGGASTDYVSGSINFKSGGQDGPTIANNPMFSMVYFVNTTSGGSIAVGGLNGSGTSASGWFNAKSPGLSGLTTGQTANQIAGNIDNGRWEAFIDLNGNGTYGTYSSDGTFSPERGEYITDLQVSNFDGFQTGQETPLSAGNISGWYNPIPEPSTLGLLLVGLGVVACCKRKFHKK